MTLDRVWVCLLQALDVLQAALTASLHLSEPQLPSVPPNLPAEAAVHAYALRARFAWLLQSAERVRGSLMGVQGGGGSDGTVCVEELLYRDTVGIRTHAAT